MSYKDHFVNRTRFGNLYKGKVKNRGFFVLSFCASQGKKRSFTWFLVLTW